MKKVKLGFTFVEVLAVILILTVIGGVSISSFNRNFERQLLANEVSTFSNLIRDYDKELGNSITDYSFYVLTGSFYYYTLNSLYKPVVQSIYFNSYTGIIKTNDTVRNDMNLTLYFNSKKVDTFLMSSTGSFFYNVSDRGKYEFVSHIQDKLLNSIFVDYYGKTDTKRKINLVEIKDQSGNVYPLVIIKNDLSKNKIFKTFTGGLINSDLYLKYEGFGTTVTLRLTRQ